MKKAFPFFIFIIIILEASAQSSDSTKVVTSEGIFENKKVRIGNFSWAIVYKFNEYCIDTNDISSGMADSLNGKKIRVTGILKIVKGKTFESRKPQKGKIYEPYHEPDKKYITKPSFEIIYSR